MRRHIIVRGEQRKDIDLERLARALLRAVAEAKKEPESAPIDSAEESNDGN